MSKNNYILCIETSNKVSGVALLDNNKIIDECNLNNGFTHSVTLFCNIDNILKKNKLSIKDIKKIKVSNGPGSFTGLRIGITAALGLAKPYNTKIEYVNTLTSLAYQVKNKNDYIISIIDAKANRVYIEILDSINLNIILKNTVVEINILCNMLNKYFSNKDFSFIFVGDGIITYKEYLLKSLNINYILSDYVFPTASSVGFIDGKISDFPIINYILASKAEREKNGKC